MLNATDSAILHHLHVLNDHEIAQGITLKPLPSHTDQNVHFDSFIYQMTGHDKSIPRIVAGPRQDPYSLPPLFLQKIKNLPSRSASRIFHQH